MQACTMLADGRILLNEVDSYRIVEHDGPPWRVSNVIQYPQSWRMGALLQVPPDVTVHTSSPAVDLLYALYFYLT